MDVTQTTLKQWMLIIILVAAYALLALTSQILVVDLGDFLRATSKNPDAFLDVRNLTKISSFICGLGLAIVITRLHKPKLFGCIMLAGVVCLYLFQQTDYAFFIALPVLLSLAGALLNSFLQEYWSKSRTTLQGVVGVLIGAGGVIAPTLVGDWDYPWMHHVWAGLFLVVMLALLFLLKEEPIVVQKKPFSFQGMGEDLGLIFKKPLIIFLSLAAIYNGVVFNFAVLIGEHLTHHQNDIHTFVSAVAFGSMCLTLPLSHLAGEGRLVKCAIIYVAILILLNVVAGVGHAWNFFDIEALYFCIGGFSGVLSGLSIASIGEFCAKEEIARVVFARSLLMTLFAIGANWIYNYTMAQWGEHGLLFFSAAINGVFVIALWKLRERAIKTGERI